MKPILIFAVLTFITLPANADFADNREDYKVEDNIEEIFANCLEEIKDGERKRIELYTCVNIGLQNQKKGSPKTTQEIE